tara:strand:+ start:66 stop:332 length:267 start_codon:yes stop_codon:yes gene_type:complete
LYFSTVFITKLQSNSSFILLLFIYNNDIIKQALTDYDPTLTDAQKDALSWIGLNSANIVAWQNLTSSERTTINSSISTIQNTFPNGCN